ncbi:hypothetical protein niasHT_004053 [Heterodera trifolii]|uniref:Tetratricopeptide repeat-containing protein n=1 Tax=Heterodera trifolii TaxID=157864 RepID=A0ABD2LXN8_9BILA
MNFAVRLPLSPFKSFLLPRLWPPFCCCSVSSSSVCSVPLFAHPSLVSFPSPVAAFLCQRAAVAGQSLPLRLFDVRSRQKQHNYQHHHGTFSAFFSAFLRRLFPFGRGGAVVLMAFSIKQLFSFNRTDVLDEDPLKDKVKRAMLHRKYGEWAAAVQVLNEALNEAVELGNEVFVSRMYYELATTFWESGQLENAEHMLKLLHGRYLTLHRSSGLSPEVIENSLRLADVYTRMGKLDIAEGAYKYCLTTQMEVMEKHLAEYHVARGAMVEIDLPIETRGPTYTDPIALFGMCLEDYAYFLVDHYADTRLEEAEEYIKEALKVSFQIFGLSATHSLNLLCTFGSKCILQNKFETARNFLELGVKRVSLLPETEPTILLSFYCCYAEALFHTGDIERALDYAKRAQKLSQGSDIDAAVRAYVRDFSRQIERDTLRASVRSNNERTASSSSSTSLSAEGGEGTEKGISNWLWPFK